MISRRSFLGCVASVALAPTAFAARDPNYDPMPEFLYAIALVEGNQPYACFPDPVDLAYGPFCIHEDYWKDAVEFDKRLAVRKGKRATVWCCYGRKEYAPEGGYAYSAAVVDAYMRRYAQLAYHADPVVSYHKWQVMARIHNGGGPKGNSNPKTLPYWEKVKKELLARGWRTAPKGGLRPPQT
jgi:hypothetical protein